MDIGTISALFGVAGLLVIIFIMVYVQNRVNGRYLKRIQDLERIVFRHKELLNSHDRRIKNKAERIEALEEKTSDITIEQYGEDGYACGYSLRNAVLLMLEGQAVKRTEQVHSDKLVKQRILKRPKR